MCAEYAKHYCNSCGKLDIQPNMVQKSYFEVIGSSSRQSGFSVRETRVNNSNQVKKTETYVRGGPKRVYRKKRTVWLCQECAKTFRKPTDVDWGHFAKRYGAIIFLIVVFHSQIIEFLRGFVEGIYQ